MLLASSRVSLSARQYSHEHEESPEQFDQRFVDYFNKPNIDGWEVRHGAL